MTDFQFLNASGTINVTLRTDYIGAPASIVGGENLTVHDIVGLNTDEEKLMFANFQKNKYSVADFKAFATANTLKLIAIQISKPESGTADLITIVLATPTSFSAAVNSATQITLTWVKSANATGYIVDRATNVGFTTGLVSTTVGDVAVLVVTGLTTATQYWFRIKAIAANATASGYATDNDTTS